MISAVSKTFNGHRNTIFFIAYMYCNPYFIYNKNLLFLALVFHNNTLIAMFDMFAPFSPILVLFSP